MHSVNVPTTAASSHCVATPEVVLVEDAAEALGASCQGCQAGSFGAASTLSFNGNKIITPRRG